MLKIQLSDIVIKVIKSCFLAFSILAFIVSIVATFISATLFHEKSYFSYIGIAIFLIIAFLFYIFLEKCDSKKNNIILISILSFCLLIRLAVILFFNVAPQSDFRTYNEMATTIANGERLMSVYGSVFPHTTGYSIVMSFIYKIFGVNVFFIQIFNVIVETLTAYLIYKLTSRLVSTKTGLFASFLYAIFPSFILYSEIIATEMLFTLLFLTIIYLICLLNGKIKYLVSFFLGISVAITNAIRPSGPVILFAIALYIIFMLKDTIIKKSASIAMIIIIYLICFWGAYSLICNVNGIPVAKSPVGYNLYVGGNVEKYGAWNIEDATYSGEIMRKDDVTPDEFHKKFFDLGIKRYIENGFINNSKLAFVKFGLMWATDMLICFYLNFDTVVYKYINPDFLKGICNGYHMLLLIFIILGAKELFFNENTDFKKSGLIFISLMVMGIASQHIIAEVMERYSYSAMAVMLPIASYGFYAQMCKTIPIPLRK